MGGKNHQPCGSYLPESTRISRALSSAHAQCELANVALEDLIITELDGRRGTVLQVVSQLEASELSLHTAIDFVGALKTKMDNSGFTDLPTLKTTDLDAIGINFANRGIADKEAWEAAAAIMRSGGFYGMLVHFLSGIATLREMTSQLRLEIVRLDGAAKTGEVNRIIEENRALNIKTSFAQLYTGWSRFNALFLASSLISTEVWYAFRGYGSLADPGAQTRAA